VEFSDEKGKQHLFRNDFVISGSKKSVNKGFKVFYDIENPSNAIVYDFFYFYGVTLVLVLTGAGMVGIGYLALKL
jgi:hypothetical protein